MLGAWRDECARSAADGRAARGRMIDRSGLRAQDLSRSRSAALCFTCLSVHNAVHDDDAALAAVRGVRCACDHPGPRALWAQRATAHTTQGDGQRDAARRALE